MIRFLRRHREDAREKAGKWIPPSTRTHIEMAGKRFEVLVGDTTSTGLMCRTYGLENARHTTVVRKDGDWFLVYKETVA